MPYMLTGTVFCSLDAWHGKFPLDRILLILWSRVGEVKFTTNSVRKRDEHFFTPRRLEQAALILKDMGLGMFVSYVISGVIGEKLRWMQAGAALLVIFLTFILSLAILPSQQEKP